MIDLLVTLPSPYLGAPARPFIPRVLQARERAPIPCAFVIFTFGSIIESVKKSRVC
jgi:hypothetical protein